MNAPRPQIYRFGVFELDTPAHELRKQGARVRLQDQPYQILLLLLERAGSIVTRDELRQGLWPSSMYVDFDHGVNNAIARLREALGDAATTPTYIETIPRLGYRFIYPLTSTPSAPETVNLESPPTEPYAGTSRWGRSHVIGAGLIASVAVIGLLAAFWSAQVAVNRSSEGAAAAPQPSLAVLPFVNMSPGQDNEYFADGLSEELLSKLSGIRGLKVASQTSSFYFKGKNEPAAAIAETLQVTHLLEGSVRRSGSRVRVTAQLIDGRDGYHRWSGVFDRDFTDILQIQEDIATAVASALQMKLLAADEQRLRSRGTRDSEAYRHYLIARARISWVHGKPDWPAIKRSYEEAIARDPEFAAAHAGLAHYYLNREHTEDGIAVGRAEAERAVALDPNLSEAAGARGNFEFLRYIYLGDFKAYTRGHSDFRRALELDASNSQAMFHYARALLWYEPELALSLFERTVQLDPMRYSAVGMSALLQSRLGRHDAARKRVQELYERNPTQRFHNAIHMAAFEYYQGHLDQSAIFMRESLARGDISAIHLWGLYMSLGDRDAARNLPMRSPADATLREAASLVMSGRYEKAFAVLDSRRADFPETHLMDAPAARLALIAGQPDRARAILEQRLSDLAQEAEPINARNVLPALDLAAAWVSTGDAQRSRALLARAGTYLDGQDAPHWPLFIFLRARTHALAGERDLAQRALDRAFEAGFRTTWAVDVLPLPFYYIDSIETDPAFETLRGDPRFESWLRHIEADNARQLEQLRAHDATIQGA